MNLEFNIILPEDESISSDQVRNILLRYEGLHRDLFQYCSDEEMESLYQIQRDEKVKQEIADIMKLRHQGLFSSFSKKNPNSFREYVMLFILFCTTNQGSLRRKIFKDLLLSTKSVSLLEMNKIIREILDSLLKTDPNLCEKITIGSKELFAINV